MQVDQRGRILFADMLVLQVYSLRSYQTDIANHWEHLMEKLKERIPGHRPLWTALGVSKLAFPAMTIELEVEAIKQ